MKKIRIVAFLCALVLVLGSFSFASAESAGTVLHMKGAKPNTIGYEDNYFVLKDGQSATFYVHADYMSSLYPADESDPRWSYSDILFKTKNVVKASCSASWVHISNYENGFILSYDQNSSYKNRTATVKVKAKNYSASFKLIQWGTNSFTSVVRKKKTVTVKAKFAKAAAGGYVSIYMSKTDDEGNYISQSKEIWFPEGKNKLTFKVQKGWSYSISLCGLYQFTPDNSVSNSTDWVSFDITDENINDTETYR